MISRPSRSLPGHHAPAAGFDEPLALLGACHERMAARCATLQRLPAHLAQHGADGPAREAIAAVLRYFDSAAPHHHADEEHDLFPALIDSMAGSDAVCLRQLTQGLAAEHRVLERQWQGLRLALQQVLDGQSKALSAAAVEAFVGTYRAHTAREDAELLPMAARLLDDAALAQIGQAMQARRQAGAPPEGV